MGQSSSLAIQLMVLIALGIVFPFTSVVAAKDTIPPAEFKLLFPEDNATTYATTYGATPLLVWRAT